MIKVTKIQIPSLPTKKPRRLYIYTPKDYGNSERRYPVLYMFDGHNLFYDSHATFGKSWGMKRYLEKSGLPLIVVGIECSHDGDRRLSEYAPWDFSAPRYGSFIGEGKKTMDWIVQELKPEIDRNWRTLPDREHTLIAGSSMGGLMTVYAILAYNEFFSKGAALSPTLWAGKKQFGLLIRARKLTKTTRLYMDYGTAEEAPGQNAAALNDMFRIAKQLTAAGAEVAVRTVHGAEHSEAAWEKRIPVFMEYLLD